MSKKLDLQECQRLVKNINHATSTCSRNKHLPNLLRLLPCLESQHLSAEDRFLIRHQIWQCDLTHLIIEVLRNDYSDIEDSWRMRSNLAVALSSILAGLAPRIPNSQVPNISQLEEVNEYYDIVLPTAVDSILFLANSLLEVVESEDEDQPSTVNFYECFNKVIDSLIWVCSGHKQCVLRTLQSPYLLHILITDRTLYGYGALRAINALIMTDESAVSLIPQGILTNILDELVYKLSGQEPEGAALSLKLLAQLSILIPKLVDSLSKDYPGLLELVMKWGVEENKEGNPAEKYLISELRSRAGEREGMKDKQKAAVVIQANWKGYANRKKMIKAKKGIQKFQALFRRRRAQRLNREEEEKKVMAEATLKQHHLMSSQLAFHQKQLSLYEQLPASELQDFISKQENEAAVKIQSAWKGWIDRRKCKEIKLCAIELRSAVVIQRAMRRYLQRRESKKQDGMYEAWPDIPGPTRAKIQKEILEYRETHATENNSKTHQSISELHDKAQSMYEEFYFSRTTQRRRDEQIQFLISKLNRNCDLLLGVPSLEESYRSGVANHFISNSPDIARMARTAHREEMKAMSTPWWKRTDPDNIEITLSD